jgi:hypothetical protein
MTGRLSKKKQFSESTTVNKNHLGQLDVRRMSAANPCRIALTVMALACPASALAQTGNTNPASVKDPQRPDDAQVRELMRVGVAEYRKKNLEGARQAFAKAWQAAPRPEVAAALADVEMKLGRYRDAAEHWVDYLQSKPADQAEAAARLDECRPHVAAVRIQLEPANAELAVDDSTVASDDHGKTFWVEPGTHTFVARLDGRASTTKRVDLAAGQVIDLQLELAPPPVSPAPVVAVQPTAPTPVRMDVSPPDTSQRGLPPRTIVAIGGVTLTIAAAAVGGWFLLKRADAVSEHDQLLREVEEENSQGAITHGSCLDGPQRPAKCTDLASKTDEMVRDGNWAIGGFVSAGVLGGATVLTYVLWPSAEKRAGAHGLVVAPLAGLGTRGLQLRMAF